MRHVNIHIPWQARQSGGRSMGNYVGRFVLTLIDEMMKRPDTNLSVSRRPFRAQTLGPTSFAINYHRRFVRLRNLNVKLAYLPHYFYADRNGYSGWSEIATKQFDPESVPLAAARRYFEDRLLKPYLNKGLSKYQQMRTASQLPSQYVFVPLQLPLDTVMSLARFPQEDMVRELMRHAHDIPVVLKPHPLSRDKAPEFTDWVESLHDPVRGVFVVEDHCHRLAQNSTAVVCVNSGVGVESVLLGKPVITCGDTDYHHLTQQAHSAQDLRGLLETARAPDEDTTVRYAKWLFGDHYIDMRDDPAVWSNEIYDRMVRAGTHI